MKKTTSTIFVFFLLFLGEKLPASDYSFPMNSRQLCDLEMLLCDGFAPLDTFLDQKDYLSVIHKTRLASGRVWPIPIVLDISEELARKLKINDSLHLKDRENNTLAILTVKEWWRPNKTLESECVYGTKDTTHPGVFYLLNEVKDYYVSGHLEKIALPNHYSFTDLRKTPQQLKDSFQKTGHKKVVAFQTRNPMHRAHVELTKRAVQQVGAHLLIQPIVGLTKPGDIDSYTRVSCYRKILNQYPSGSATLSVLPLAMRMAGPREALWHALIRKNYGATHFIVGRDHAGPGNDKNGNPFYPPFAAQELVRKYSQEIGIEMIPFQEVVYVESKDCYLPTNEVQEGDKILTISGTEMRRRLYENLEIPSWLSYPDVIQELRKSYLSNTKKGLCLFFTGLSGAGKTTLAHALCEKLQEIQARPISILDGDDFRKNLCSELGFTKKDRSTNIYRAGYVANEITRNRGLAICSFIAPYALDRNHVRNLVSKNKGEYIEIYLSTPLETCKARDVKGLYKKAEAGEIKNFTGISDPYETPKSPELTIDTSKLTVHEALDIIVSYLKEHRYI